MKYQCTKCLKRHIKIRHKKRPDNKGYKYIDDHGSWWSGGQCPNCVKKWHIKYSRSKGHKPIDEVYFYIIKKSRLSHKIAAHHLLKHNFKNILINKHPNGADIFARFNNKNVKIEVKLICKNRHSYRVRSVSEERKKDDYIIMVSLEHNIFLLEKMKTHLKKCAKNGDRTLTKYIKRNEAQC